MARLFVSYRSEDTGALAPLVAQWLMAEYGPDAIMHDVAPGLTGEQYRRSLDASLRQCAVVVALVGSASLRLADEAGLPPLSQPGDRVRVEMETALALSLPILPLLVDDTPALRVENLPASLYPLAAAASLPLHSRAPLFENEIRQVFLTLDRWMRPPQPLQYFAETPAIPTPPAQPSSAMYPGQTGPYDQTLPGALTNATPSNPYYMPQSGSQPAQRVSRRSALGGLIGLGVVLAGAGAFWLAGEHASNSANANATGTAGRAITTTTRGQTGKSGQVGMRLTTFSRHTNNVDALAWSPDGQRIASGSWDNTVRIWDASTAAPRYVFSGHSDHVISVAWSPDGARIASASDDGTAKVWDADTGTVITTYTGHAGGSVWSVAWSPDGQLIASGGRDSTAQVWDPTTGQRQLLYQGHTDAVRSICWSPDGSRLATASYDHTARVWDLTSESALGAYTGHSDKVWVVGWSADGASVASGGDTTVHVWDPATFVAHTVYKQHTGGTWWLAWSPRGRTIASCSADTTVRLWNADDGATSYVYRGHPNSVNIVAWSHDGQRIASGSDDHTVQVWRAS